MKTLKDYLGIYPEVVLSQTRPCLDAVRVLDVTEALVLVTDEDGRFLGTVADSDVRKALIRKIDLGRPVSTIMNGNPSYVHSDDPLGGLLKLQQRHCHAWVPVLNREHRLTALLNSREVFGRPALYPNQVVILAGGKGVRMRPLTLDTPKSMLDIGGQPLLEIIVGQLREYGFRNINLAVNYLAEQIVEHFKDGRDHGVNINYINETTPLGTAGCLSLLTPKPKEPVIVINGDLFTGLNFERLLRYHVNEGHMATACVWEHRMDMLYGVVHLRDTLIENIEEKPEINYFVNAGIYVISPKSFEQLRPNEPYDMPDFLKAISKKYAQGLGCFLVKEFWIDIGRPKDYERAEYEFNKGKTKAAAAAAREPVLT